MTTTAVGQMSSLVCFKCGIEFHVPSHWKRTRQETHTEFFCPNGHAQGFYGKSPKELRIAELEREKVQQEHQLTNKTALLKQARAERDLADRRRAAAKGQLTKTKNRIAAGVCPCCNRTFTNVARHMKSQHPDYSSED